MVLMVFIIPILGTNRAKNPKKTARKIKFSALISGFSRTGCSGFTFFFRIFIGKSSLKNRLTLVETHLLLI